MNKGVVMEISDKSIIVMRPDGKFERVSRKKRNCEIGEEITYADSGINWRSPSVAGRSAIAAAVIFCLVLFASFNGKLGSPEVIAYISMDINPSIEMGIDMNENVLELRGLNEDGNELVQNISYKGEKLESVASRLLDKAEEKSLAKGEAEIVIASTVVQENAKVSDTQLATKLQEQVTKHIEKTHPAEASSYQVAAFAAPQEVRQAAVQNGVSMGKYTVYLNAKNSGTEVTLDELKKGSVLQLSKEKPEISKAIQSGAIPSKSDIKKLVEEEKSGQLDKKLEEKLKEKKDNNGKGSTSTGSQPGKNGQTNQNEKNGQGNQTNQNGQNGKTDPKKPGTAVPSKPTDKKDNDKNDRDDDKKDDRKDNKSTPVTTRPGTNPSNPQTKPGTTNPGTVRPGDKQDDRKEQDKKKEEERKREEALKNEEQRRKEETARRLEEQKKKAEEQKKEQEKKEQEKREQEKKEQDKKEQDKKEQDKKDQDKRDQDKKDQDKKTDDSKKNDGKDDDKSRGGGR